MARSTATTRQRRLQKAEDRATRAWQTLSDAKWEYIAARRAVAADRGEDPEEAGQDAFRDFDDFGA